MNVTGNGVVTHLGKRLIRTLFCGLAAGLVTLPVPLLRDLHWESASLVSLISALAGAWMASGSRGSGGDLRHSFFTGLALIFGWAASLFVYTIITNCFSLAGVGYWVSGPLPSLLFGLSLGRLVGWTGVRGRRMVTILFLLVLATVPTLFQFLSHPQLYFFNHIWSYWPGPIYDEIVRYDIRLLPYRAMTILWVALFWVVPELGKKRTAGLFGLVVAGTLAVCYLYGSVWGLTASERRLQSVLGQTVETDHFRIFYSSALGDSVLADELADRHELYLLEIADTLSVATSVYRNEKIHSYIYASQEEKKALTGAGQTSYVPVWLEQDQLHIALTSVESVLKHELVHVVAKQFGNWFGASISIGMVEGLAVAVAPDRHGSTADRLVAGRPDWPGVDEIRQILSPAGFYAMAGPVSYVISGSFVSWLLREFPVGRVKEAYRFADVETAYAPYTLEELVAGWHRHLQSIEIDATDRQRSITLYRTPSLFQKPCPRVESQRELQAVYLTPFRDSVELPTNCYPG